MDIQEKLLEKLKSEPIKNVNMINFIRDYPLNLIKKEGASLLIQGTSDKTWTYISSSSKEELKALLKGFQGENYAVVEDWMMPYISEGHRVDWELACMKLYYPWENTLPEYNHDVKVLTEKDAHYIYEHSKYKAYTDIDYIKERMEKGIGLGVYEEQKLVGWVLTHDDGAIGFLNVLEAYRKKGYAHSLTVAMIKALRQQNKLPFVHIEENNEASMNLALNLGFIKDHPIRWGIVNSD